MPRPYKCRFVCKLPSNQMFAPSKLENGRVFMTVDEYEVVRLIDLEDCTQEECCIQMQVARTTIQKIYGEARKKIANAIVNGKRLIIEGGEISLCPNYEHACGNGCQKHCKKRDNCFKENNDEDSSNL